MIISVTDQPAWVAELVPNPAPAGWQRVPHPHLYVFDHLDGMRVIVSGDTEEDPETRKERRWLHVSLSRPTRMPTIDDINRVKGAFVGEDRYAAQVFPPKRFHVNYHRYCLHLWASLDGWPLPEFSRGLGMI